MYIYCIAKLSLAEMVLNLDFATSTHPRESMKMTRQSQTEKSKADQVYESDSFIHPHGVWRQANAILGDKHVTQRPGKYKVQVPLPFPYFRPIFTLYLQRQIFSKIMLGDRKK